MTAAVSCEVYAGKHPAPGHLAGATPARGVRRGVAAWLREDAP